MKAKKLRKVILSFALSAALLVQPMAGMPVVLAEETQTADQLTGDSNSDDIVTDSQTGNSEDANQGDLDDPDKKDDVAKDPGKEDGSGEEDKETDDSTEGESGDTTDEEDPSEDEGDEVTDDPTEDSEDETDEDISVSGNGIDDDETEKKEDDSDKDSAMPEGYKLTSFQRELKAELGNILGQFSESDEGVTYAERRVFTFAGSQEEAEMIAEAYNAEIIEFDMGVLTLKLSNGVSVKSALMEASDLDNNLPAVWPDYRRELYGEVAPETAENAIPGLEVEEEEYSIEDETAPQQESEDEVPSPEAYEQALNELDAYNDPYLKRTDENYQWFHNTIGSVYAWDAGYTGQNIKVGVVDSGVDSNADLNANVFGKTDFCDGTSDAEDYTGDKDSKGNDIKHGTHVAGIIAAVAGNNSGGAGVAPGAKVYNAKVFGNTASKSGYDSTIARAILVLINENENVALDKLDNNVDTSKTPLVDIINMSLGGPAQNPAMQRVFNKAYKKGVIVFAAAGNDGGSLAQYPASYNNVISVAATDTNNGRAYFSNYGSTVDLAAPGVDIWSTYANTHDSLQGTSMACPVAAGEAAVILSGQAALSALNGKTGQARVKAVESIMKSNTIGAGSGMGKGITSLPKVFKLSTAATKPNAPKITAKDVSTATEKKMNITIEAQAGMKICYTTDGKNPVFLKDGTTGTGTNLVTTNTTTITVNGKDAAKGTIKAIAVNASGTISSVKSYKYTLQSFVEGITISGPKRVEQGKAIQLAATVTPTYAANKNVEWTLKKGGSEVNPAQIKIDAKGKITTKAATEKGTYTVTATAKDGSGKTGTYTIDVIEANTGIQKISFAKDVQKELWLDVSGGNTVSLLPKLTAEVKGADGKNHETAITTVESNLSWTSSKPAVATVDDNGNVTALAVGTTTITVKTDDNLAKKATVNITVKQAVTGITIEADNFSVAAGKSLALKAILEPGKNLPGKPSNNKVNWSIAPASNNEDGKTEIENKNVAINKSNGKVTVKAAAKTGKYIVTAEAADGKGKTATKEITVVAGAIGEIKLDKSKVTLATTGAADATQATITATIKGVKNKENDFLETAYKVTNSNPDVVTATPTFKAKGTVEIALSAVGTKYGKANIVIASTDGSNKKATCVVTVKGGITKVELVDEPSSTKKVSKLTLFRKDVVTTASGTATIYAKITGSEGAYKQAYNVTSSDPRLVAVAYDTSTNKIDLTASKVATGKATITVMTTDGSKKKATCTVTVVNPASRINIAPKAGTSRYAAYGKSVQLTATMETDHGAIASKAVVWSVPDKIGNTPTDQLLTVSASGKVTVKKNLNVMGGVPVTATAKDGSGLTATYNVGIVPPTAKVLLAWNVDYKGWLATASVGESVDMPFVSNCVAPMMVTSSTPGVASPSISYTPYDPQTGKGGTGTITIVANKKGKTTITVKALDGTGKSDSMVLWVNK